ncbi:MAG TPA: methylmalonyl Co-A mutase-associated GTPase MeaB [Deltaproteobacteria bacterium]|nr:methylmalonyl Co-A mutase-associated GTPase MeaB [Deltaproteobacteria bacterium]
MPSTTEALLQRAVAGERRALARMITWIEARHEEAGAALSGATVRRRGAPGRPHVVGVTGPPGAGKSTFVDRLISWGRAQGETVGVLAVDPSSPFSGGAILGDRIRMERHTADDGVFIRSLSSRGHLGGLSSATAEVVDLLDAVGFDRVVVETVGVGQSELGVMEVADTVVVVLTPESGDAVQAMKAGLLEIGDVFVVNKSDRPGADRLVRELLLSVELAAMPWASPVLSAVALQGEGVEAVAEAAAAHLRWCRGAGEMVWRRRRGDAWVRLVLDLLSDEARQHAVARLQASGLEPRLRAGELSPQDVARRLA